MRQSPMAAQHERRGETLGEYRGSVTPLGGARAGEWPPKRPWLVDANWRAAVEVRGPEARKWLNGMITANVRDLGAGRWAGSFMLDPRGHVLASLDVACLTGERFLLLTEEDQRAGLVQRLRGFVFVSKLELIDRSEEWSSLWLRGEGAMEAWRESGAGDLGTLASGGVATTMLEAGEGYVWAANPGGFARLEVVAPVTELARVWEQLEPVAAAAGAAEVERDRVLSREPRYGVDVTERELAQETGQMERLDYTKGCYIGQEIVERIRARGTVHRHWRAIRFTAPVKAGATVEAEGKEVGVLTSVAERDGHWLGLGYVRNPAAATGTKLRVGGAEGEVEA
jgi:folate-binding protein YgfZ